MEVSALIKQTVEILQTPLGQIAAIFALTVILILISALVIHFIKKPLTGIPSSKVSQPKPTASGKHDEKSTEQPSKKPGLPEAVHSIRNLDNSSWLKRLKSGLGKTRDHLNSSLSGLFSGKLDEDTLEQIHESLYRADIGVETCDQMIEIIRQKKDDVNSWEDAKPILAQGLREVLTVDSPEFDFSHTPLVILVVGVNGVGKTTTIGKLAAHFEAENKSVILCAGDTFRAAAIDQLGIWAERTGVPMVKHQPGSDPAAVVYDGIQAAKSRNADVLLVDTAGRLHNKEELMAELTKIKKIVSRESQGSSQQTLMVIDATTGQNAAQQVKVFNDLVSIDGLVVTKLDGTAKGGAVIGICNKYKIPIKYIGVGEQAADLRRFNPEDFISSIF